MALIAGKYKVVRQLGSGSTGIVYLVKHLDRESLYALKLLSSSFSQDEYFIARFKTEAAALERFRHSGSVQLRDFGKTVDGQFYMTMDYCDGESLRSLISDRGNFGLIDALDVAISVLDVLDAAHSEGIVHRDIKPENIMAEVSPSGRVEYRVLDFSIAKLIENENSPNPKDTAITMAGSSIGTPQYMAPEQVTGEISLDHRVDIYSTGILLYELLTARLPIQGNSVMQTLLMQSTKAPDPFAIDLGLPLEVEDLVFKALAKNRSRRYHTAAEFRDACLQLREKYKEYSASAEHAETEASMDVIPGLELYEYHPVPPKIGKMEIEDEDELISSPIPIIGVDLAASQTLPQISKPEPEQEVKKEEVNNEKDNSEKGDSLEEGAALEVHGEKVLILDDDPTILKLLEATLGAEGYQVYPISDCAAIHDLLFREHIKIMVTDVQMPGLPGTKICQMLKQSIEDIKIILFSSIDEDDLAKRCNDSQADDWMSKQWLPQQWVEKIAEVRDSTK